MNVKRNKKKLFNRRLTLYIIFFLIIRFFWLMFSGRIKLSLNNFLLSVVFIGSTVLMIMDVYIPRMKKIEAEIEKRSVDGDEK